MKHSDFTQYFSNSFSAKKFGSMPDGQEIVSFELSNQNGMKIELINFGATLTSLKIPIFKGELIDVVLGFDNLDAYLNSFNLQGAPYFGATVGRFAGRIKNSTFVLNEKAILLNANNNNHALHGGVIGISQRIWAVKNITSGQNPSVTFSYLSPDLEENYPGNLNIAVKYTLTEENELKVDYDAVSDEDTIINLTHHSYFNLDGHRESIAEQLLFVNATTILEKDDENIPTGQYTNLENHDYDFSILKSCPLSIDDTFVINKNNTVAASLVSSNNNLKMDVYTNQPAVHIYVGGSCSNIISSKDNIHYHAQSGICFETQNFPDAPNHASFPSCILKKDIVYNHATVYKFSTY